MDRSDEVLSLYSIEPDISKVEEIRELLINEIANKSSEDHEYLKTLCIQLFSIGEVQDTLLIWRAKNKDFDAGCYIDVQLLCGAGLDKTINYLKGIGNFEAKKELSYIEECQTDFKDFDRDNILNCY